MSTLGDLLRKLRGRRADRGAAPAFDPGKPFPPGHFYSPVIDLHSVRRYRDRLWGPGSPQAAEGIDLDPVAHRAMLAAWRPLLADFGYPDTGEVSRGFFDRNGLFTQLDSRAYFALLRQHRPRTIIEVGCGYSSLISMDVNRRFLDGAAAIHLVEPFPPEFLAPAASSHGATLHQVPVQDLDPRFFDRLRAGDVLFIDSTHVSKTGSDVNHLFFQVLPRLVSGVVVHFHDIFLPDEYPEEWVFTDNRSWNEQYLLRAFLMFNERFRVLFGCHFAGSRLAAEVEEACGTPCIGGSFWLQVR